MGVTTGVVRLKIEADGQIIEHTFSEPVTVMWETDRSDVQVETRQRAREPIGAGGVAAPRSAGGWPEGWAWTPGHWDEEKAGERARVVMGQGRTLILHAHRSGQTCSEGWRTCATLVDGVEQ